MTVCAFLSNLAESSRGIGGVDQAKSAVRHLHNLNFPDLPNPSESIRVANVLKGIKRRFLKPVQKKKAITNKEFSKLLAFVLKGNSMTTMS